MRRVDFRRSCRSHKQLSISNFNILVHNHNVEPLHSCQVVLFWKVNCLNSLVLGQQPSLTCGRELAEGVSKSLLANHEQGWWSYCKLPAWQATGRQPASPYTHTQCWTSDPPDTSTSLIVETCAETSIHPNQTMQAKSHRTAFYDERSWAHSLFVGMGVSG